MRSIEITFQSGHCAWVGCLRKIGTSMVTTIPSTAMKKLDLSDQSFVRIRIEAD